MSEDVIDLAALDNYQTGMILKDKRNSKFHVDFVGNFEISITNIGSGKEKEVPIYEIVKKYTIVDC